MVGDAGELRSATRLEPGDFYGVSSPHREELRYVHNPNVPRIMLIHQMGFMHRRAVGATTGCFVYPKLISPLDDIRGSLASGFNAVKTFWVPGCIAIVALSVHVRHREKVLLILAWSVNYEYLGSLAEVYLQP